MYRVHCNNLQIISMKGDPEIINTARDDHYLVYQCQQHDKDDCKGSTHLHSDEGRPWHFKAKQEAQSCSVLHVDSCCH